MIQNLKRFERLKPFELLERFERFKPLNLLNVLFSHVIAQSATKEQLLQMVQQNRLSHALLFLGKEGSGALSLALAMSQYINCEKVTGKKNKAAEPSLFGEAADDTFNLQSSTISDACGECPSCQKAAQLVHPDIHYCYPVIPSKAGDKPISTDYIQEWREFIAQQPYGNAFDWLQFIGAENKQGNITADECNDIIRKLSLKSFESGYKTLILWMPEYLGKEGNKLLKLIEEPPPDTLFILVAENESMILPTILSRTQLVKIPLLSDDEIESALQSRAKASATQARQIAAVCEGNYREALQQLQHSEEDLQSILREWLNSILKTGPVAQVKWIDEMSKTGREKQKQFLRYFIHLLEQAVRLRAIGDAAPAASSENKERDFAMRLNKLCTLSQQEAIINELDKASYYIERNANGKMLFHALSIKLYHIISNNSLILVN
jgi:DNA polymerase-3 subunit delta'